jgi:glycosyltransferase involved in cell wall biosynthesis
VDALRQSLGLTERHFVVGMPARLEHYKGQSTVLEAAARCKNAAPDMRFLFLGDGSQIGRYQQLAKTLDIEDRVRFCGFVDDLAPYYALMNVNVNASFGTETSSLSLSEGMSVGVPALASRYGGNPRMIESGVNGFLFPPHDAKALADLLLRLHDDLALLHSLSEGALRLYRERFTAEAMVRQVEGLYTRLVVDYARRVAFST